MVGVSRILAFTQVCSLGLLVVSAFEVHVFEVGKGDRKWKLCHPNQRIRQGLYAVSVDQPCKPEDGSQAKDWQLTNSNGALLLSGRNTIFTPEGQKTASITYDPLLKVGSYFSYGWNQPGWKNAEFSIPGGTGTKPKHNDALIFVSREGTSSKPEDLYLGGIGGTAAKSGYWRVTRGGDGTSENPAVEFRVWNPPPVGPILDNPFDDPQNMKTFGMQQSTMGQLANPFLKAASRATNKGVDFTTSAVSSLGQAIKQKAGWGISGLMNKVTGKKPDSNPYDYTDYEDEYAPQIKPVEKIVQVEEEKIPIQQSNEADEDDVAQKVGQMRLNADYF